MAESTTSTPPGDAGSRVANQTRRRFFKRLRSRPGAIVAGCFILLAVVIALLAPLIVPYAPERQDLTRAFEGPSLDHLLGTDGFGRDLLSRLIYGMRTSLIVAGSVVLIALVVTLPVGLLAGHRGGMFDAVIMRLNDAALSIPGLIIAIALAAVLRPGIPSTVIALSLWSIPYLLRFVRAEALARSQDAYIEAGVLSGLKTRRLLATRLLPNVRPTIIVTVLTVFGHAILAEASLSYLGIGAQPPTATLGNMLRQAYDTSLFNNSYQLVVPGMMIAILILAFYTLGDGVRDALSTASMHERSRRHRNGLTMVDEAVIGKVVEPAAQTPAGGNDVLLRIRGLTVEFEVDSGSHRVVDGVDLDVRRGEVLGLVGESGSGKTVTSLSIMRLVPSPPGKIVAGSVNFDGIELLALRRRQIQAIRGARIAMIFQDPMAALDPAMRIGRQLEEAYCLHHPGAGRDEARARALELLERVHIADSPARMRAYPHELSGGMRQRVMIAMALMCSPDLLIADEPTTSLDVTIQAEVLELIRSLQADNSMSILFVTHDLGVIAELCDRVAVMYAGQIVEQSSVEDLFLRPQHPYTSALLAALPQNSAPGQRLAVIPGRVPPPDALPPGCRFHVRCAHAAERCTTTQPAFQPVTLAGSGVRCIRSEELSLRGVDRE